MNQHFVPKFYLKNFSNDNSSIRTFLIKQEEIINNSSIKWQASKSNMYWEDLKLEIFFKKLEWYTSNIIKKIINEDYMFSKDSEEHYMFLLFIISSIQRNPITKSNNDSLSEKHNSYMNEISKKKWWNEIKNNKETNSHYYKKMILRFLTKSAISIVDLDFKLLTNNTNIDFITSDNPISKYNKLLLKVRFPFWGKIWYILKWLQYFIPINSKLTIAVFDKNTYKIWNKNELLHKINDEKIITELNLLQYWNADNCIFFENIENWKNIINLHKLWRQHRLKDRTSYKKIMWWNITVSFDNIVESKKLELSFCKLNKDKKFKNFLKRKKMTNIAPYLRTNNLNDELEFLFNSKSEEEFDKKIKFLYIKKSRITTFLDKTYIFLDNELLPLYKN